MILPLLLLFVVHSFTEDMISYPLYNGPLRIIEKQFNGKNSITWKVIDKNDQLFSLRTFTVLAKNITEPDNKITRLVEFVRDQAIGFNISKSICSSYYSALTTSTPASFILDIQDRRKYISCPNRNIAFVLGINLPVLVLDQTSFPHSDLMTASEGFEGLVKISIKSTKGLILERIVDFKMNILIPLVKYRLSDILIDYGISQTRIFRRYALYMHLVPQLVNAIKSLHSQHYSHLSLSTNCILCSDEKCTEAYLTDFSHSWNGQGSIPIESHEVSQLSWRITPDDPQDLKSNLPPLPSFSSSIPMSEFQISLSVDWFSLGCCLLHVLIGARPSLTELNFNHHDNFNSHGDFVSQFFYNLVTRSIQTEQERNKHQGGIVKVLEIFRSKITEGLLLVDGLMQEDRSKRISFDIISNNNNNSFSSSAIYRLRRKGNSHSLIQAGDERHDQDKSSSQTQGGESCSAYIKEHSNPILIEESSSTSTLPSFMTKIC